MRTLLVFLLLLSALTGFCQQPDSSEFVRVFRQGQRYELLTKDGFRYRGEVTGETRDSVQVLSGVAAKELFWLAKQDLESFSPETAPRIPHASEYGDNDHAGTYMFSSSAYPFEEGEARTTGHWLLLENIDYALSDNWAVMFNTIAFYPVSVGVKCAYQVGEQEYLGANVYAVGDPISGSPGRSLFGYGGSIRFTRGSTNNNITAAAGVFGINTQIYYTVRNIPYVNMPYFSLAYTNRIRKKIALTMEGWYLPEIGSGLGGAAVKFVGNDHFCWTVGCFTYISNGDQGLNVNLGAIPLPYFSLARRFR